MIKKWIGQAFLRAAGWKMEGERPFVERYVFIAAPHTSNWDLPFMLAMAFVYDIPVRWMGKHILFRPPFGPLFKRLGGIPIVRHRPGGVVGQMVEHFENSNSLALMVTAEGTRSYVDYWKSGFYHIARGAHVPVILSYLDFGRKVGGIGPAIELTGGFRADMDEIRAFYEGKEGLHPEKVGEIRIREEDIEVLVGQEDAGTAELDLLAGHL